MEFGFQKYKSANNWMKSVNTEEHQSFKMNRLESAKRHLLAYDEGEFIDPESNCFHMSHAAVNCLMVAYYDFMEKKG